MYVYLRQLLTVSAFVRQAFSVIYYYRDTNVETERGGSVFCICKHFIKGTKEGAEREARI